MNKPIILSGVFMLIAVVSGSAQSYDLQQLLKEKKLVATDESIVPLTDNGKKAISFTGLAWLKDATFSNGTIEVDLRGKDILQKSFLGIAFHGVDTLTYDLVYFRPFNFQSKDSVRKIHAVQYVSHPDFPWNRLRQERNGIFEKAVNPAPQASEWFHARIEINNKTVKVFVNGSPTPSLVVEKLNNRKTGKIGIWNEGENGDFANLVIRKTEGK